MGFNVSWKSDSAIMLDFVNPELEMGFAFPDSLFSQGFRAELGNFHSHDTFGMQMRFLKCKTLDMFRANSFNEVLVRTLSGTSVGGVMSPSMASSPTQYMQSPRSLNMQSMVI